MKIVHLKLDHRRRENGKEVLYKAGTILEVSDKEFLQITNAVRDVRISNRLLAEKIPGSIEWKAKRK